MRIHSSVLVAVVLVVSARAAHAGGAEVYLTLEQAPAAVFPQADSFERADIEATADFQRRLKQRIGRARPSIWEPYYITFIARKAGVTLGYAVICEEIGKHRPITFITAVTPEGKVKDVAVMMYREPIGGEVRYKSFLQQFQGKHLDHPIMPHRDIKNISGATLSVRALSRGVRKALAVIQVAYLEGGRP